MFFSLTKVQFLSGYSNLFEEDFQLFFKQFINSLLKFNKFKNIFLQPVFSQKRM